MELNSLACSGKFIWRMNFIHLNLWDDFYSELFELLMRLVDRCRRCRCSKKKKLKIWIRVTSLVSLHLYLFAYIFMFTSLIHCVVHLLAAPHKMSEHSFREETLCYTQAVSSSTLNSVREIIGSNINQTHTFPPEMIIDCRKSNRKEAKKPIKRKRSHSSLSHKLRHLKSRRCVCSVVWRQSFL